MIVTQTLASFEAQLDGVILQHTAAVDAFLASRAAAVWAPPPLAPPLGAAGDTAAMPVRALRRAYARDAAAYPWRALAGAAASGSEITEWQPDLAPVMDSGGSGSSGPAGGTLSHSGVMSIFSLPESPLSFREAIGGDALFAPAPAAAPQGPATRRPARRPRGALPAELLGADAPAKAARLEQFLDEELRSFLELRRRAAKEEAEEEEAERGAAASAQQQRQAQPEPPPPQQQQQQQAQPEPQQQQQQQQHEAEIAPAPQEQEQQQEQQQRQQQDAAGPAGGSRELPVFESDEDIAAQKAAAREAMALLGAPDAPADAEAATTSAAASAAAVAAAASASKKGDALGGGEGEYTPLGDVTVPARPRPFAGLHAPPRPHAPDAPRLAGGGAGGAAPVVVCGQVVWWLVVGLLACFALQPLLTLQSSWAGSSLAFAPKGRLLLRLQHYPWALSLLPAAALAALLPALLRGRVMQFADARVEARYAAWLNRRHAGRDLLVHLAWLAAATALYVQARAGASLGAPWAAPAGAAGGERGAAAAAAALTPLALLGPCVPAALAAALRRGWYAAHREAVLVSARLAQAAAVLALRAAAPARLEGAWPLLALAQLSCALLMRVRFSTFLPAQLVHVLAAACAGGACATGAGTALHFSRLLGLGWCAPALLVLALETYSRRSFAQAAWPRRGGGGGGGGGAPPAAGSPPPAAKVV